MASQLYTLLDSLITKLNGTQLIKGPQGLVGPAGAKGAKGTVGAAGPVGPTGPTGNVGNRGPVGPTGPGGDTGDRGPVGNQGSVGAAGNTGSVGAAGTAGPVGPTGPVGGKGSVGPTGPRGANCPTTLSSSLIGTSNAAAGTAAVGKTLVDTTNQKVSWATSTRTFTAFSLNSTPDGVKITSSTANGYTVVSGSSAMPACVLMFVKFINAASHGFGGWIHLYKSHPAAVVNAFVQDSNYVVVQFILKSTGSTGWSVTYQKIQWYSKNASVFTAGYVQKGFYRLG